MPGFPGAAKSASTLGLWGILEARAVVRDRLLDEATVLVEASQVVLGLAAARVVLERGPVGGLRLVVAPEPVQQQPEVVPRGGVARIDRDDPPVRLDRVLPVRGVVVPLARALEPRLGLLDRRRERPDQARHQGGVRRLLEPALVERQDELAAPRVEANAVGLRQEPVALEHESQLDQRLDEARVLPSERRERLLDLPDGGPGVEERAGRAQREQVAEGVARLAAQEL